MGGRNGRMNMHAETVQRSKWRGDIKSSENASIDVFFLPSSIVFA